MNWFTPAGSVLLTGAGFTHNFGGVLASEMWSLIFNQAEIQQSEGLRRRMLEELNYEALYAAVLEDGAPAERDTMKTATRRSYEQMHQVISSDEIDHRTRAFGVCRSFVSRFAGEGRERGFVFTLNQDLFIEKFYSNSDHQLDVLGLRSPAWFNDRLRPTLERDNLVRLPDESKVDAEVARFGAKGAPRFVYVKLHGSLGWIGSDGGDAVVVGTTKSDIIQHEPLLRWYLSVFTEVLRAEGQRLVVVGYGFKDEHINNIIADAIRDAGLRLIVISPLQPMDFRNLLVPVSGFVGETLHRGLELWEGLAGYYRGSITDFYDATSTPLPARGAALFRILGLPAGPR